MKKFIIIFVIFLLVVLIPKRNVLKDGGSVEYQSLFYKVTFLKSLDSDYENNIKEGLVIELFNVKVFEKIISKMIDNSDIIYIDNDISLETGYDKAFKEGLLPIKKNGKIGFMNKKGKIVIDPIYDSAFPFVNGLSRVLVIPSNPSPGNSGSHGYIDKSGKRVSEIIYGSLNDFSEGYGLACLGEIQSFQEPCKDSVLIDRDGNVLINSLEKDYVLVGNVSDELILSKRDDKYGYVDTKGNIVIDFKYNYGYNFKYGYSIVRTTYDKLILIDKSDKEVLDLSTYEGAYFMNEKFIAVKENDKWGLIDFEGNKVVDTIYNYLTDIYEGFLVASLTHNTFRLINTNGEVILDLEDYDMVGAISEGLIPVTKNKKIGFIDLKGNVVIDFLYDNSSNFSDGLAYVVKNGKEKFINKKGKVILSYE